MTEFLSDKEGIRLDKYLSEELNKSRSLILKMLENECILVNGKLVKPSYLIKLNDKIEIVKTFQEEISLEPENIPLEIVYESENIIIINKPSGLVVHPGNGNQNHTLVNGLLYYTNLSEGEENRPGIVHRIDKDTSGLMVVAKNEKAHQILSEGFKNKQIKRKYLALVKGVIPNNNLIIDAPIGRDAKSRIKMAVTKNGKNAVTHVKVLKRYKKYTLVECELETGRTHQIRVHLSYIGYPIYNDPVYGKEEIASFGQFLHSSEISLDEPITKEHLYFKVPLPLVFENFLMEVENEKE